MSSSSSPVPYVGASATTGLPEVPDNYRWKVKFQHYGSFGGVYRSTVVVVLQKRVLFWWWWFADSEYPLMNIYDAAFEDIPVELYPDTVYRVAVDVLHSVESRLEREAQDKLREAQVSEAEARLRGVYPPKKLEQ